MKVNKVNLLRILAKEDKKFWRRTKNELWKEDTSWTVKMFVTIVVTIVHFAVMFMHALHEVWIWSVDKKIFRSNLQRTARILKREEAKLKLVGVTE